MIGRNHHAVRKKNGTTLRLLPTGHTLGERKVLCIKKGVMPPEGHCKKFRYDPLKRTPPRPAVPDFSRLKDTDFTL